MIILISLTMKLIYGHRFLARWSCDSRTGVSSTTWAELLSTIFSGTLQCQLSPTSLHPTLYLKAWTKCPTWWAWTLANPEESNTMVWPIQTSFATMNTHICSTAILLNEVSFSCNSLGAGIICRMLQQRNSMMLRNLSTQRWNQVTGGAMNRYISWIAS